MSEQATRTGGEKEIEIPEWENAAVEHKKKGTAGGLIGSRSLLDRLLPPQKQYLGLKRKTFLWIILATSLCLLALIIGLSSNLPLPSNADTFTGDLTCYQPGLGACGVSSTEDDFIVALSHVLFDAAGSSTDAGGNSNENPLCGRMLRATRYNEEASAQRSVDLRVVDRCTGCEVDDLDISLKAFERLAPSASGRVDVSWAWLQPVQTGS
ncbi:hypothetical protein KC332_g9659 [Hortaea werneckii]|uniref:RlpA-like protein double-psi beta-barrel domain-containing protein n=1 Tax=Hortaea werneckii EXF-2000 TaxID=1157616 RepID=A0A1Z5SPZ6_HORWE|nr:hypothetical protein KC358_g10410 [Hortaea werneckii]OTA22916.1 hypothetical protein BTJ68_15163 [Hortaea werneckii EXF-2000]KAI6825611.1 hypothetical protein KC350_g8725 [Hortaea werneckii]KAI6919661.1 hypothetical protein KC348_g10570 [Hortaea werneckii]KAI6942834.1 hypothetical protein KC341_g1931 [Hortaea werneckii]